MFSNVVNRFHCLPRNNFGPVRLFAPFCRVLLICWSQRQLQLFLLCANNYLVNIRHLPPRNRESSLVSKSPYCLCLSVQFSPHSALIVCVLGVCSHWGVYEMLFHFWLCAQSVISFAVPASNFFFFCSLLYWEMHTANVINIDAQTNERHSFKQYRQLIGHSHYYMKRLKEQKALVFDSLKLGQH